MTNAWNVLLRMVVIVLSAAVTFAGAVVFVLSMFGTHTVWNIGYAVLCGAVPMLELPAYLVSFKHHKLAVVILWILFIANLAVMIGETVYLCGTAGCGSRGVIAALWMTLGRTKVVPLSFTAALLAQVGFWTSRKKK